MAKGTLQASATTTKKGGSSSARANAKTGKASIVGAPTVTKAAPAVKKAKASPGASAKKNKTIKKLPDHSASDESGDDVVYVEQEGTSSGPRHLNVKDRKYDKHYRMVIKDSLEGMDLLYPEDQDKIETILKLFDLEPEYGPAAGMTRLERWKRASAWGLDPPAEVYDILTTIEGQSKDKYSESLFFGRV